MSTKLVIERGTAIREVPKVYSIWSGKAFLEYQKKKITSLPIGFSVITKRGTASLKVSDLPTPIEHKLLGKYKLCTARGTSTRYL